MNESEHETAVYEYNKSYENEFNSLMLVMDRNDDGYRYEMCSLEQLVQMSTHMMMCVNQNCCPVAALLHQSQDHEEGEGDADEDVTMVMMIHSHVCHVGKNRVECGRRE